jgi:hypothetical protein
MEVAHALFAVGPDLFLMEVGAFDTIRAVRRFDMASMSIQVCGSSSGCPEANDNTGEGVAASFYPTMPTVNGEHPDVRKLVFTAGIDVNSSLSKHAFIADLDNDTITELDSSRCIDKPSWSSDGEWIAYLAGPAADPSDPLATQNCNFAAHDAYVIDPADGRASRVLRDFTNTNGVIRGDLSWYEPLLLPSSVQ